MAVALLLVSLVFSRFHLLETWGAPNAFFLHDLMIAITFSLLINSIAFYPFQVDIFEQKNHRKMADFSYSLYLTHYPMCLLISAMMMSFVGFGIAMQPNVEAFSLFVGIIIITYLYAFCVSVLTERKTSTVRRYMKKFFLNLPDAKC